MQVFSFARGPVQKNIEISDCGTLREGEVKGSPRLQDAVPHGFRIKGSAHLSTEEDVCRVCFQEPAVPTDAVELVTSAESNRPDQFLDGPVVVHEAPGEMVQEFRVRGAGPIGSEVIRGIHNAAPEEMQPDPVCHHPRGLRVITPGEPVRQLQAPACA